MGKTDRILTIRMKRLKSMHKSEAFHYISNTKMNKDITGKRFHVKYLLNWIKANFILKVQKLKKKGSRR